MRWGLALGLLVAVSACRPGGGGLVLRFRAPVDDADADVYVDGNYVGTLGQLETGGADPLMLAPGVHRVEIRKTGRFPVQKTVKAGRGSVESLVIDAQLLEDPD